MRTKAKAGPLSKPLTPAEAVFYGVTSHPADLIAPAPANERSFVSDNDFQGPFNKPHQGQGASGMDGLGYLGYAQTDYLGNYSEPYRGLDPETGFGSGIGEHRTSYDGIPGLGTLKKSEMYAMGATSQSTPKMTTGYKLALAAGGAALIWFFFLKK